MGLFATNKQNQKTTKMFLVKKELSRLKYNTVQLHIVYCSTTGVGLAGVG